MLTIVLLNSRYDPSGLGESEGVNKIEARFSLWLDDAKEMLVNMTEGPQIVICSSMGCWVSPFESYSYIIVCVSAYLVEYRI